MSETTSVSAAPGRTLMYAGVASLVAITVIVALWSSIDEAASAQAMLVILFAPILIPGLVVSFIPFLLMQSVLAGVPSVSMTYAAARLRRDWRGVLGGVCAAIALVAAAILVHHSL